MRLITTLAVLAAGLTAASAQTVSLPASDDPVDFAWTLYRKTATLTPGENTLISPYSAREALGLAYIGARGATAEGLAKALRAGRKEDFLDLVKKTREEIASADPKTTIEIANSLWLRSNWKFLDTYVARAKDGFGAEVFRRDFSPQTAAEANGWASRRTHGKITKILDSLGPDDVAVLMNAVYFKGVWKRPFDKKKTRDEDFHLASGEIVKRPRMSLARLGRNSQDSGAFGYAEDADMQAVRLPYGSGRIAMTIVLPAPGASLAAVAAKVDATWWRALRDRMEPRIGDVQLPRFKYETKMSLKGPLSEMGASSAFGPGADFQDMAGARRHQDMLYISEVQQKALIEVDEAGTVAAAVTAVTMRVTGARMQHAPPPFVFVADRPFLFAIEDEKTGTMLFVGSVQDPR